MSDLKRLFLLLLIILFTFKTIHVSFIQYVQPFKHNTFLRKKTFSSLTERAIFCGVDFDFGHINSCYETPTGRHKKDWVLIVTDRGAVVHVRAYGAKTAMKKGLFRYLRECCGYDGRENMEAVSEWIEESGERLGIDIVQQDIRGKSD